MTDYFRVPNIGWWLLIVPALAINYFAYANPILIKPIPFIGPIAYQIGTDYHGFTIITNLFAILAHVGEAIYAFVLCRRVGMSGPTTLKWVIQTFILGFPSLSILSGFVEKGKRN